MNKLLKYLLSPFLIYGSYAGANVDHETGLGYTYYILEYCFGIKIVEINTHGYYPCTDILKRDYPYVGRDSIDVVREKYIPEML